MDFLRLYNSVTRGMRLDTLNLTWKHKVGNIRQDIGSGDYTRGQSFYTATYQCPKCGEFLYKAHAPIGFTTTDKRTVSAKNVFACFDCQNLFAVEGGKQLGGGEYNIMDDTSKFYPAVEIIDSTAISISELRGY